jgi:hypothetical protein
MKLKALLSNGLWLIWGVCAFTLAFSAAVYLHENAAQWELPVAAGSFAVAALLFLALLRVPKRVRWLAGGLGFGFLSVSMAVAIFHGLQALVTAIYLLVVLAFVIALARWQTRVWKLIFPLPAVPAAELPRDTYAMLARSALADERTALVIYPSRGKLIRTLCLSIVALVVILGGTMILAVGLLGRPDLLRMLVISAIALLVMLSLYVEGSMLYRIVSKKPSLVVTASGIVDNATLHATGMGFIPWDEITGMMDVGHRQQRSLMVMVANPRAVRARQGFVKRLLLFAFTQGQPSPVKIWAYMLPEAPDEVLTRIQRQIEAITAHDPNSPARHLIPAGPSLLIRDDDE